MNVAILTQPLHTNYGGNLQAFALQYILRQNGLNPLTINYRKKPESVYSIRPILSRIKNRLLNGKVVFPFTSNEYDLLSRHHRMFIDTNINYSVSVTNVKQLHNLFEKMEFEAVIVGSDQTWRPIYSPRIDTFFLDFLTSFKDIKKLSYAASFGTDEWEFSPSQTKRFSNLLKLFDFVSVRERSGVILCNKHFDVKAEHVLDPTLLVDKNVYIDLFRKIKHSNGKGKILNYILDAGNDKQDLINKVSSYFGKDCYMPYPVKTEKYKSTIKNIDEYIYPPVEEWLKSFHDADFIITDSFHGTVFSIIFNKPFIAIANEARGKARFSSLLELFDLQHRLVTSESGITDDLICEQIDYTGINERLAFLRKKSIEHLINNVK